MKRAQKTIAVNNPHNNEDELRPILNKTSFKKGFMFLSALTRVT